MKAVVVYYSMGGNTEYAAKKIAEQTGADLLRINPVKQYPDKGFRKFLWGGKSALMSEQPPLVPYDFNANRYDWIIFGFPVWAGSITPPIRTFITEQKQQIMGKSYAAFACQSGSGAEKAFTKLEQCLGTPLLQTLILIDPKDKPDGENTGKIRTFCESLQ